MHCAQPQQLNPFNEEAGDSRSASELGIRIGWDDEQVTIWMNRQFDPSSVTLDFPLGVLGYRIDVRIVNTAAWYSLVHASGPLVVGNVNLGQVDVELGAETHPVQLNGQPTGDFWLPTFFTTWIGGSLIGVDEIKLLLTGGPDLRQNPAVKGVVPTILLQYGNTYEFRVRLMDQTGRHFVSARAMNFMFKTTKLFSLDK